ncbi:MAG: DNA polymerase III subunit delta [Alcaligenaceae bacterium]|nr:DNA polymerase III subunit delta [Alcaligenaceae bacterium]
MGKTFTHERFVNLIQQDFTLDTLYCVCGDELLLRNETIDSIRLHCRNQGYNERTSLILDANGNWSAIQECTQSISLFGDLKILEITIPTGKPGKTGATALINLANQVKAGEITDTIIVISLPKLDRATAATKWAQQLFDAATVINIANIDRQQLPGWIKARLQLQNQSVDDSTQAWITDKVEGNLFAAHQEILKLGLLYPEGKIQSEDIEQAILDVARYDVFSLSNAMLEGNGKRTVRMIQGLKSEGEALPLILGVITREIRTLYTLAVARQKGENFSGLFRQLRIFPPRDKLIRQAMERLSLKHLMGMIQHAHDIDRLFKGYPVNGRMDDAWEEITRLALKVVNPAIL